MNTKPPKQRYNQHAKKFRSLDSGASFVISLSSRQNIQSLRKLCIYWGRKLKATFKAEVVFTRVK